MSLNSVSIIVFKIVGATCVSARALRDCQSGVHTRVRSYGNPNDFTRIAAPPADRLSSPASPARNKPRVPRPLALPLYLRTLPGRDRKSTRLNSSHLGISYAVFCLKKKELDRVVERLADGGDLGVPDEELLTPDDRLVFDNVEMPVGQVRTVDSATHQVES